MSSESPKIARWTKDLADGAVGARAAGEGATLEAQREDAAVEIPLSYYWYLLRRYQWHILTLVFLVTAAVALISLSLTKKYESVSILRVDPAGLRVVGDTSQANSGQQDSRILVSTEARVLVSPAVVEALINQLHLENVPEFAEGTNYSYLTPTQRSDRLLRNVVSHIVITQPLDTFLLEVHFRSRDAQLAATAANTLSDVFLEHEYTTRAKALTDSSKYMADQIDNLRAQMERDQTALVNYESQQDVLDPDNTENIYLARLSEINSDLTQAESLRMSLEADYRIVQSGDLDALLASPRGESLTQLNDRLLIDQRELSRLGSIDGPRHPLYQQQEATVAHDQLVLTTEQRHVAAQVRDEYAVAVERENLIRESLAREKKAVDAFNLRAVNFHVLKAAADSSTQLFYDLQKQIQDATVAAGQRSENLRLISPAEPSDRPVSPRIFLWTAIAFFASILLGIGAAVLVGVFDTGIASPDQVERWFRLPVIGSLPSVGANAAMADLRPAQMRPGRMLEEPVNGTGTAEGHHSAFQEAILGLHSAIRFAGGEQLSMLAISSTAPGEGKSTVSANLASTAASLGIRTILIDADMRKPNVHRIFGLRNVQGLSTVLRGRITLDEALQQIDANLNVLTSGPSVRNPAELLHLGLEGILDALRNRFDLILVDCPPVLGFADTSNIARQVGAIVLVVHAGSTDRANFGAALRQLSSTGGNVLGVILNRVSQEIGSYYGYYRHYGNDYYAAPSNGD